MAQTENTLRALQRDGYRCVYCWWKLAKITPTWEGHHILGRAKSDRLADIIALCPEHHHEAQANLITQDELYDILENRRLS